jgi:hypothetical protein
MKGSTHEYRDGTEKTAGLIPRAISYLFPLLSGAPTKFNVYASFLQIYNEKVFDLLQVATNTPL